MTERIFEVEISNKTSKGYETATALEMPATWAEFHDALEKARIKDARDCHNELTKIEYPGIQRGMIGDNVIVNKRIGVFYRNPVRKSIVMIHKNCPLKLTLGRKNVVFTTYKRKISW